MPHKQAPYENGFAKEYLHANLLSNESKALFAYTLSLFIIPLFPLNQLIVGTIVNALLISSALSLKTKKVFLLALIPSVAAVSGAILFGPFTPQLLLMLPFIWAGNSVLMLAVRKFALKGRNYFYSAFLSTAAKTAVLFASALMLFSSALVPALFLTAFGAMQFITAIAGFGIVLAAKHLFSRKIQSF